MDGSEYGNLILSRRVGEKIIIDHPMGPITITVVSLRHGNQVQLGIAAARHVPVWRGEIHAAMKTTEGK